MRVGFEGTAYMEPTTGVGQYVRALWQAFAAGLPGIEPVLLLPGPRASWPEEPPGAIVVQEPPRPFSGGKARKLWWEQIGLPLATRRSGAELVHIPYHSLPLWRDRPHLITIHDLIPLVFPVYTNSRAMGLYYRFACRVAPQADLILTDSEHSAGDLRRYLGVPGERVRAIPLAADARFRPLPPDDPTILAARAKYGLAGPFAFNVGGLDVRKNLIALVQAFALARPQLPEGMRLVIAGAAHSARPDRYPDLAPTIAAAGLTDRVVLTGRIDEGEKLALLNAAAVYAYPSRYEGFGLSPLEAMCCGTPVICSDRSSLPEVVGEGGILMEPTPQALAAALVRVMATPEARDDLRRRALAQAARFTWSETARLTAAAYGEVMRNPDTAGASAERGVRHRVRAVAGEE